MAQWRCLFVGGLSKMLRFSALSFSSRKWFPLPTKWVGKAKETKLDLRLSVSTAHDSLVHPRSFLSFRRNLRRALLLESWLWYRCAPLFGETKSLNRGRLVLVRVSENLGEPADESQVYQQGLLFFFPLLYSPRFKPRVSWGTEMDGEECCTGNFGTRAWANEFSCGTNSTRRKIGGQCSILLFGKPSLHIECRISDRN